MHALMLIEEARRSGFEFGLDNDALLVTWKRPCEELLVEIGLCKNDIVKILKAASADTAPPTFHLTVRPDQWDHDTWEHYLERMAIGDELEMPVGEAHAVAYGESAEMQRARGPPTRGPPH